MSTVGSPPPAVASPSEAARTEGSPRLPKTTVIYGGALGTILILSIAMWSSVWITGHPASSILCPCGDPAQNVWLMAWFPWSIGHLHNPFFSGAIFAGQGGANMLSTNGIFPGFIASPITVLFGPVMAFNVLSLLVPVINGWSMLVFLRKISTWLPGALIGSLLYAFSPYVVTNSMFGHFAIDLVFFPPLVLWCLYDLLFDRRHHPVTVGLILSALVVIQFFNGPELLAMCAVLGLVAGFVLVGVAPRSLWERRRVLAMSAGTAVPIVVVTLAYPTWFLLAGPRHIVGYPWPRIPTLGLRGGDIVNPGGYDHHSAFTAIGGYFGPNGPPSLYLGTALLVVLAISAIHWARRRVGRWTFAAGLISWWLALGTGPHAPWWHLWRIAAHIPVVDEIIPGRFSLFVVLAAAVLLALSLDGWWAFGGRLVASGHRSRRTLDRRSHIAWGAACCGVALGALVPIASTYGLPLTVHREPAPAWMTTTAPRLPAGSVLLAFPVASSGNGQAMAWQANAGFSFAMVGGYAIVPGADGRHSSTVDPLRGAPAVLDALSWGDAAATATVARADQLRHALVSWRVRIVVLTKAVPDPRYDVAYMTAVLGRAPLWQQGVWVWYGIGARSPLDVSQQQLLSCSFSATPSPLAVPSCVLAHAAA